MKEKILFWIEDIYTHFGLAESFHKKNDYDLFAIFDVFEKPKKFFQRQKLVNFKKSWFYLDEVHKNGKTPDFKYLKDFEKKYKINLWLIIHTERYFLKFNRYHKFTTNEILSLIEQECRFFEKLVEEIKPDYFFIYQMAWHHQQILHEICRAKNVKILVTSPIRFGFKSIVTDKGIELIDNIQARVEKVTEPVEEVNDFLKQFSKYREVYFQKSSNKTKLMSIIKFFISKRSSDYKKHYRNYGKTKTRILIKEISKILKRKYRENYLERNSLKIINNEKKFVYFPLMYEPERGLLVAAPFHVNQIEAIKNIARSLPIDYELYVKDHPKMYSAGWRSTSYYKEIKNIFNVKFIHPSISNNEITKKCSLVITVGGTSSLEAAFHNKPSITFVKTEYSALPSVHELKNLEELPEIIKMSLEKKIDISDLEKFLSVIDNESFIFHLADLMHDLRNRFEDKAGVMDMEISDQKMSEYLEKHQNDFKILMEKHLERIKEKTSE